MKFKPYSYKESSTVFKLLIIIVINLLLTSCEWGDEIGAVEQPNPDDFAVLFSDTVTVQLSTVGSDSLMTGGPSRMLFGNYIDPYFGTVRAANFFQPTTQGVAIANNAEYDSLILSLTYDRYNYGDTTRVVNMTVHRLLNDILEKTSYWNSNSTDYEATPIGNIKFAPRPYTTDFLKIRLSDQIGKQVFELAQNNLLTSNADWINIVKGLVILPGATDNGAMVGFKMGSDSTSVQLHYHTPFVSEYKKDSAIFNINSSYNQILGDYTGTQLAKIPANKRIALPSGQSGNMAFMQAGMGNMIRVDLPFLKYYKSFTYIAINRAFLRIRPFRQSVTDVLRVPQILYVYRCDKNNQFYASSDGTPLPLYNLAATSEDAGVSGSYIHDYITNDEYYLLDISSFATEIMTSETDNVGGLIIRSGMFSTNVTYRDADTEFSKSVDRLVVADQHHSQPGVELELFYTNAIPK